MVCLRCMIQACVVTSALTFRLDTHGREAHSSLVAASANSNVSGSVGRSSGASSTRGAPQYVQEMLQKSMHYECVFTLMDDYTGILGEEKIREAMEQAINLSTTVDGEILDAFFIIPQQAIDASLYSKCKVDAPLIPCVESLPPRLWLQQKWIFQDVYDRNQPKFCPWCAKKDPSVNETQIVAVKSFFQLLVRQTNFSASRAKVYCDGQSRKPLKNVVRSCILNARASFSTNISDVLTKKWALEDKRDTFLVMAGRWYDFKTRKKEWQSKAEVVEWQEEIRALDEQLAKMDTRFNEKAMKKTCEKQADPAKWNAIRSRVAFELADACDARGGCQEKDSAMSPSGFACDIQKDFTPERSVVGFVIGDLLAIGVYPSIFGTIGFFVGGPAAAGIWASWGATIPNIGVDVAMATLGAAAVSRSILPTCMAFPLKCGRPGLGETCEVLLGSRTMRGSKNPLAHLPMEGFKCVSVPQGPKKDPTCSFEPCTDEDLIELGPVPGLFGRVGHSKDGTYNCANTGSSKPTLLGNLEMLPVVSDDGRGVNASTKVPNTVQARNALLSLYPDTSDLEKGLQASPMWQKRMCSADALDEIKARFQIVRVFKNGRAFVRCKNKSAKQSLFKVSCSSKVCAGSTWCFVQKNCGGPFWRCHPQPDVQCD